MLVAKVMGLTLEELLTIYRVQFPVLQQNERDTWYDRNGRIVFTTSKGLTGVGFPRSRQGGFRNKEIAWQDISEMTSGTIERKFLDATLPGDPKERTVKFEAPFDRCDRVEDYKIAWDFFDEGGSNL